MNYKTTTILLAIITVGLIVYVVYEKTKSTQDPIASTSVGDLHADYEILKTHFDKVYDSINNNLTQAGRPITPRQAMLMIKSYH